MSAFVGRLLTITRTGTGPGPAVITGKMSKEVAINNGEIDITSDDDNGYRTLLASPAVRSIDFSIEGVLKESDMLEFAITEGVVQGEYSIDFGSLGTLEGTFQFSNLKLSAPHDNAVKYTADFKSSGAFTFTPDAT
jgi:predicted secreted protein